VFCFEFAEGVCAGKITAEARRRRARCFVLSSRRVCCGENNRGGANLPVGRQGRGAWCFVMSLQRCMLLVAYAVCMLSGCNEVYLSFRFAGAISNNVLRCRFLAAICGTCQIQLPGKKIQLI
jgi:hypothetical protein